MDIIKLATRVSKSVMPTSIEYSIIQNNLGNNIPTFYKRDGSIALDALDLVYLYRNRGRLVHKSEIAFFVVQCIPTASLDRQCRHLRRKYNLPILLCGTKANPKHRKCNKDMPYYDVNFNKDKVHPANTNIPDGYYGLV